MHYAFSNISLQSLHDFLISQVMKNMSQGQGLFTWSSLVGEVTHLGGVTCLSI